MPGGGGGGEGLVRSPKYTGICSDTWGRGEGKVGAPPGGREKGLVRIPKYTGSDTWGRGDGKVGTPEGGDLSDALRKKGD